MRIYLAARYSRYPEMQLYAKDLQALGHVVTSRWIWGSHELPTDVTAWSDTDAQRLAQEDWQDLAAASCCISFTEAPGHGQGRARGGRHVELGLSLAWAKRCVIVGHRENTFHWLPAIEYFTTWEACLTALTREFWLLPSLTRLGPPQRGEGA